MLRFLGLASWSELDPWVLVFLSGPLLLAGLTIAVLRALLLWWLG